MHMYASCVRYYLRFWYVNFHGNHFIINFTICLVFNSRAYVLRKILCGYSAVYLSQTSNVS